MGGGVVGAADDADGSRCLLDQLSHSGVGSLLLPRGAQTHDNLVQLAALLLLALRRFFLLSLHDLVKHIVQSALLVLARQTEVLRSVASLFASAPGHIQSTRGGAFHFR
jgi:hypothetical protein